MVVTAEWFHGPAQCSSTRCRICFYRYIEILFYMKARHTVFIAKQAVTGKRWGISESCMYELDKSMNYKYAAHGVPAAALKGDMENERVISPYSSFLASCIIPDEAVS